MTARRLMQILSENDPETILVMEPGREAPFMALNCVKSVTIDQLRGKALVLSAFKPDKQQPKGGKIF